MHVNRFHWAISHYIGSQLRQCVLDPDGGTIYGFDHPRRLPSWREPWREPWRRRR